MSLFCVTRKQFLDRLMAGKDLAALVEMLRQWYLARAGYEGREGQIRVESRVYGFPAPSGGAIGDAIAAQLPGAVVDRSRSDELRVSAQPQRAGEEAIDLSIWEQVLREPLVQDTCVILRLTIQGPVPTFAGQPGAGCSTFVLCGAPLNGSILLKALWNLRGDEAFNEVFRCTPWDGEQPLLEALETFIGQSTIGPAPSAASLALRRFGQGLSPLFTAESDEQRIMKLIRRRAELPDERTPRAFAKRIATPLLSGIALAAITALCYRSPAVLILGSLAAAWQLYATGSIAWKKFVLVRKYYQAMRRGLGKLYETPAQTAIIDLGNNRSPSLLKASGEIEALGGKFLCDIRPKVKGGEARLFAIGDTLAAVALLNSTENLLFFPAKLNFLFSTRFADGRRHYTLNRAVHRKPSLEHVSGRSLLNEGGAAEVLALHRRHVDKMIAGGAVPIPPPKTTFEVIEQQAAEFEDSRKAWAKQPYSWGDALYDAFKVCRKEFLAD